ncbi:hypothetical protein [Pseudomonas putida]
MDLLQFNTHFIASLEGYSVKYSQFERGDFGGLDRVELDGFNKLATLEFWSKGWIGFEIFDCSIDQQVMNELLSPDEVKPRLDAFEKFMSILKSDVVVRDDQ